MSLTQALSRLDRTYLKGSPVFLGVLGSVSVYYVAFSYGVCVTGLVIGKKGAIQVLGNAGGNSRLTVWAGMPLIPVVLVGVEAYDIEGKILSLWRNSLSHWVRSVRLFGSLVERIWPTPNREPHISTQEGLMGSMDYLCRCLCAGLLFPFVAYAVGYLFRNVIKTRTGRTILGGLMFFSVRTVVKVYLRQQEYRRQGSRRVLNYNPV